MQSRKQTHQKFVNFANAYYDPYKFYNWSRNQWYLFAEMWYLSSNIHRWFLSTITAGTPGPEQSQSYRQSVSPDFYVHKFWRLICDFFISASFHKDTEFICPRTCISYVQVISTTQSRQTAICQTQTTWLDKRRKRLDKSTGRDLQDNQRPRYVR